MSKGVSRRKQEQAHHVIIWSLIPHQWTRVQGRSFAQSTVIGPSSQSVTLGSGRHNRGTTASEDDFFGLDGAGLNANRANHRPTRAPFLIDVETMWDLLRSCCELVLPHPSLVNRLTSINFNQPIMVQSDDERGTICSSRRSTRSAAGEGS